jgi:predicted thioesterase
MTYENNSSTGIESRNPASRGFPARDHVDVVSRGTHVRAVIDMERFLKRIKRKSLA